MSMFKDGKSKPKFGMKHVVDKICIRDTKYSLTIVILLRRSSNPQSNYAGHFHMSINNGRWVDKG